MIKKFSNFKYNIVTTRTPLRISFSGGGTDMPYFYEKYGGVTISSAIDKFIYVTVKRHENFNEKYRLNYSETEIINKLSKIKNLRIRETLKYLNFKEPLYINTISDLPYNTGLGSSSAFLIGLIKAIFILKNIKINLAKICEIAFKIENKITNNSLGKQDHYIAAYGGIKKILYSKKNINIKNINIKEKNLKYLNDNLIFFWTGKLRTSNKNLTEQKKNLKANLKNLKKLKRMSLEFEKELIKEKLDLKLIGNFLDTNWKLKKGFSKDISDNDLDKIYRTAIKNGCYGGKLLGAGGGGFFLFVCKKELQKKIIKKLNNCKKINFSFENSGAENCFFN